MGGNGEDHFFAHVDNVVVGSDENFDVGRRRRNRNWSQRVAVVRGDIIRRCSDRCCESVGARGFNRRFDFENFGNTVSNVASHPSSGTVVVTPESVVIYISESCGQKSGHGDVGQIVPSTVRDCNVEKNGGAFTGCQAVCTDNDTQVFAGE